MDIMLDGGGDLFVSGDGDIVLAESVAQKVRIRLRWLKGEWRWDVDEGLPYLDMLLVKNPDTDGFESEARAKIFEVEEVVDVRDVRIDVDPRTRRATMGYEAATDYETLKGEEEIACLITG